ncbi:Methyltransferase domain-containing protein [Kytococcus aerolatus]|uniref:Methyltransferase domain-containing protein n=1 Tax=Kytococcus aerolatus TaxID=592308 RepID=A0A212TBZ9_9MICO|nr:class I SAM-dependent methyltransferase [Kytococcus aerolatus]SNC63568.1 Methyltransferase domain-containing protein [Kytococcus aerolatus]
MTTPDSPDATPQHHGHQRAEHPPESAEHWDEMYAEGTRWSGHPNEALTAEAAGLAPGRALDVGCGEGADAVWLAQQGWEVTALDISQHAVEHTLAAADRAGVRVTGVASPLQEAELEAGRFDLVVAMYPVLQRTAEQVAERRLAELVAPGGTLLFVHHVIDPADTHEGGFDPTRFLTPDAVRDRLGPEWEVVTDELRTRHVTEGAGAHRSEDHVVRARRR